MTSSGAATGPVTDWESLKQEILSEMRREVQMAKEEILAAISKAQFGGQ